MKFTRRGLIGGAAAVAALSAMLPTTKATALAKTLPQADLIRFGIHVGNARAITGDEQHVWEGEVFEPLQSGEFAISWHDEFEEFPQFVPPGFREFIETGRRTACLELTAPRCAMVWKLHDAMDRAFIGLEPVQLFTAIGGEHLAWGECFLQRRDMEIGDQVRLRWEMIQFANAVR